MIGLLKLETYPNLALEKVRAFYGEKAQYVTVQETVNCEAVYCSSLFDWTDKSYVNPDWICGGTGFDVASVLPPEIDRIIPRVNFGFTTRGCIRKCPFCVVPEKEGSIRVECDLLDLWDGKAKDVTLFDNNILALPEHFERVCKQARENKIRLDFNQGLDHRLLTPEITDLLKSIKHTEYRFAFDHPNYLASIEKALDLLGNQRCTWYVLVGFDTTFEQDLERLEYLKSHNQNAFVQRYRGVHNLLQPIHTTMARWANQHHIFQGMTWEQFLEAEGKPAIP